MIVQEPLVGRRIVRLDEDLMHMLQRRQRAGQGELIVVQAPLDVEVGFHEVLVTPPLGADDSLMPHLQPGADRFKIVGRIGAPTIGDQGVRNPLVQTGGVQHHQCGTGRFGRRDRPRQRRAGVSRFIPPLYP
jgi:hypothetical protein